MTFRFRAAGTLGYVVISVKRWVGFLVGTGYGRDRYRRQLDYGSLELPLGVMNGVVTMIFKHTDMIHPLLR